MSRPLFIAILSSPVAALLAGMSIYAFRTFYLRNAPMDEELARRGQSALLGQTIRQAFAWTVRPIEYAFEHSGASPDLLTISGTVLCAVGSIVLASGDLTVGGLLILFSSCFDFLDGRIARKRGISDRGGEFLDSTMDRYADAFCFGAAAFLLRDNAWNLSAALLAFGASGIVPYARAKAEALGAELRGGLMQRPERVVLLSGAAIFSAPLDHLCPFDAAHPTFTLVIWILAIGTAVTAVGRTIDGLRATRTTRRR
ncbi:MAG TPA: CDP-alcohol phosphatidyltransferase family protein [Candidatus Limnocylindrales bacterium]|nr:CDP-alcohol phosphatidyltransferase family protein [Candidatus Limnocylindrales bacterium]